MGSQPAQGAARGQAQTPVARDRCQERAGPSPGSRFLSAQPRLPAALALALGTQPAGPLLSCVPSGDATTLLGTGHVAAATAAHRGGQWEAQRGQGKVSRHRPTWQEPGLGCTYRPSRPFKNTLVTRQETRPGPVLLPSTPDPRTQGGWHPQCADVCPGGTEGVGRKD